MHKQLKRVVAWLSRKRVLLFVIIFSLALLCAAIYRFAKQNKWLKDEFASQVQNIELNSELAKLSLYIKNAESADRGYAISGDPKFIENFDPTIDSIRATYKQVQQLENRREDLADAALFLKSDSLIQQKIAFMQRVITLCDNNNRKAALALIGTDEALHLSDSITKINKQISDDIQEQLRNSQTGFLKASSSNNKLAYSGIVASMLLIVMVVYFLMKEIRKTKKISEDLQVRKDNYRVTLNSLGEGLISTDKEGHILYMNLTAERLTGWNWQEAKKQPLHNVFNVVNEKTGKPFEHIVSRILKEGKKVEWENNTLLKAKDSRTFIISNSGSPLLDLNGSITGVVLVFDDITKRKKAEQEIRKSEEKYRSLIEQAAEGIFLFDQQGNIVSANTSGCRMVGYAIKDILKMNLKDITPPAYAGKLPIRLSKGNEGDPLLVERQIMRKDGTFFYTEVSVQVLTDGNIQTIVRDITERKKAEQAIKKEKELSDFIINSLPGVFYFYDENLKLLRWNRQFENVTGYSAVEIGMMNPVEFFEGEDRKHMQERSRNVFASGSGDAEASFTTKAGKKVPFYFTGLRMQYEGKLTLLGIGIDITELKNAETKTKKAIERYDILAQATSDTIWDWEIVNNKIIYNDGIYKMFGYDASAVENVVDWWNQKLHPEDLQQVTESLNDIFEKRLQRFQLTYRFRCADGSYKHIFDRAFVVFDESNRPSRIIGSMQDITYQVHEEIRIGKAIINAQEEERRHIGEELHDNINQILVGSLLSLGMVKETAGEISQASGLIETTKGHIGNAINEIRKLSHQLAPATFDDNSLKDIFESLLVSINLDNRLTISLLFGELNESVIHADIQINLYRILQEQIKNILKYSAASAVEIAVTLSGNAVKMRIFDNGKGFNTKISKNGIGLSNIKKRAESLSGTFILNSAPGEGCEMIIEIPLSM